MGFAHAQIDRGHVNFVQHLVAVFEPADVENYGSSQHQAQHHLVCAGAITQADKAVVHGQHNDGTHNALGDGTAATSQTIAAHNGGSECQNFQV